MRRPAATIVALLAVLAVLVAAVVLVSLWPRLRGAPSAAGDGDAGSAGVDSFASLSRLDPSRIVRIDLASASGTVRLERRGGAWKLVSSVDFDTEENAMQGLLNLFESLDAERTIDGQPASLEPYGLEAPQATGRATLEDGSTHELRLGSLTAAGDSYYVMASGDPRVHTVYRALGGRLLATAADLWTPAHQPIEADRIRYLRIDGGGRTIVEVVRDESMATGNEVELIMTSTFVTRPWVRPKPVNWSAVSSLAGKFGELPRERLVDPAPASLSPYGLAQPSHRLVIRDERTTLDLEFGRIDDGGVYFRRAGEPPVYQGDRRMVELLAVDPFTFVNKFAAIVELERVERIDLEGAGRDHVISIGRQGSGDAAQESFAFDGTPVEEKGFRDFYMQLISLLTDAVHDATIPERPEFTITYHLAAGPVGTYRVSFVPYDADFYAVFKNGSSELLVNRVQLRNLLAAIDAYAASVAGR